MTELFGVQFKNEILFCLPLLLIVILFALLIVNNVKLNRLQKKYKRFMRGSGEMNIEQVLSECIDRLENHDKMHTDTGNIIHNIENMLLTCVQRVGIIRFNAYDKVGSDLSYTIALLDGKNNGVVICSLFSRESCITYAKPILSGQSEYTLSTEETEAVQKAIKSNPLSR